MKNIFKKTLCLVACFAMFSTLFTPNFSKAAEAGKPDITVTSDKEQVNRDEEFTVSVNLNTNSVSNIAVIDLSLKFDTSVVEAIGDPVSVMPTNGGFSTVGVNGNLSKYGYSIAGDAENGVDYNGVLYKQTFKAKQDARTNEINFSFDTTNADLMNDMDYRAIEPTTTINKVKLLTPMESISFNKNSADININTDDTLTVTFNPNYTTDTKEVKTWESSAPDVVEIVSSDATSAQVRALKLGTATITATTEGGKNATCVYTVKKKLNSISFDKTSANGNVGDTDTLVVTYDPDDTTDDKTLTWETSNAQIAEVNNGTVTFKKPGSVTITATASGKSATCTYTVYSPIKNISLGDDFEMIKGQTKKLNVTYDPEDTTDDKTVSSWTSSDEEVVSVDANGQVKALKEGTATITATVGTHTASVEITATEIPINSIAIAELNDTMLKGEKAQLSVIINPENTTDDKTAIWSFSNGEVIAIGENGSIEAIKEGETTITVTVGAYTASKTIKVVEYHLESLDLSNNDTKLNIGKDYYLDVQPNPANCTDRADLQWISSDESVVKLSEDGVYTALKEGKATISVKATTEYGEEIINSFDVEVVSEKVADSSEENTSSSPQTGDLPIGAIAVVATISLVGSMVVLKKKLVK